MPLVSWGKETDACMPPPTTPESSKGSPKVNFHLQCFQKSKAWISALLNQLTPSNPLAWWQDQVIWRNAKAGWTATVIGRVSFDGFVAVQVRIRAKRSTNIDQYDIHRLISHKLTCGVDDTVIGRVSFDGFVAVQVRIRAKFTTCIDQYDMNRPISHKCTCATICLYIFLLWG